MKIRVTHIIILASPGKNRLHLSNVADTTWRQILSLPKRCLYMSAVNFHNIENNQ